VTAAPLVHFLEEQQRHRRTSALSAVLVVVAAAAVLAQVADLVLEIPHVWMTGSIARSTCCPTCALRSGGRMWTCHGTSWPDSSYCLDW
jgi:hypothetical protein